MYEQQKTRRAASHGKDEKYEGGGGDQPQPASVLSLKMKHY